MSLKYNPYATQLFKLTKQDDADDNAALVNQAREEMHPGESIADDEYETDDDDSE